MGLFDTRNQGLSLRRRYQNLAGAGAALNQAAPQQQGLMPTGQLAAAGLQRQKIGTDLLNDRAQFQQNQQQFALGLARLGQETEQNATHNALAREQLAATRENNLMDRDVAATGQGLTRRGQDLGFASDQQQFGLKREDQAFGQQLGQANYELDRYKTQLDAAKTQYAINEPYPQDYSERNPYAQTNAFNGLMRTRLGKIKRPDAQQIAEAESWAEGQMPPAPDMPTSPTLQRSVPPMPQFQFAPPGAGLTRQQPTAAPSDPDAGARAWVQQNMNSSDPSVRQQVEYIRQRLGI
jgi:hypothetical protein